MSTRMLRNLLFLFVIVLVWAIPLVAQDNSLITAIDLVQQGMEAVQAGDFEEALDLLNEALETNVRVANQFDVYYLRGLAHTGLNELEAAEADFSRQIEIDPEHIDSYLSRGIIRSGLSDYQGVADDLTVVIDQGEAPLNAYYFRAYAYLELEESEAALDDFNELIEQGVELSELYLARGILHAGLGQDGNGAEDYWQYTQLMLAENKTELIEQDEPISADDAFSVDMAQGVAYLFEFEGKSKQVITIMAEASGDSENDPLIILLDEDMLALVGNDDISDENFDSLIEAFTLPKNGTYYLIVTHAGSVQAGELDVTLSSE